VFWELCFSSFFAPYLLCLCLPENVVNIGEMETCSWHHAISTKLKEKKKDRWSVCKNNELFLGASKRRISVHGYEDKKKKTTIIITIIFMFRKLNKFQ